MSELIFEVTQEADGGYVAECLTESIFTQADDWEELRQNVREATSAYFFDRSEKPPFRHVPELNVIRRGTSMIRCARLACPRSLHPMD